METTANATIENNFTYHAPTHEQAELCEEIRNYARNFAYRINNYAPNSREKSLAMTKLEEAVMWANAAIVRYGGQIEVQQKEE